MTKIRGMDKSSLCSSFHKLQDKKEHDEGINVKYYYPSTDLCNIVKYYWIVRVNDTSGNKKLAKISPSGFPEMIFHFADSVSINTRSGNLAHQPSESLIAGQITQPVMIDMQKSLYCLCVKLQAWSLSALFGISSTDFTDRAMSLDNISGKTKQLLNEQLFYASGDLEKIEIIEQCLRESLEKYGNRISPATVQLINYIKKNNRKQLSQITKEIHVSSRTLQRKFKEDTGISAKMFCRILRFNKAYHLIRSKDIGFQDICFQLGYYDLSHLTNEFKAFTGNSPIKYFKE